MRQHRGEVVGRGCVVAELRGRLCGEHERGDVGGAQLERAPVGLVGAATAGGSLFAREPELDPRGRARVLVEVLVAGGGLERRQLGGEAPGVVAVALAQALGQRAGAAPQQQLALLLAAEPLDEDAPG
ncbi:MAG: hypothetical protein IPN32_24530 [Deltaproteobacteria bacterium]|nr:hypothetical protein [Deltaproteobacteria bacterium]